MVKKLLIFGIVAALIGGGYAWRMFNKPHEDIRKMKPEASVSAIDLINDFTKDHTAVDEDLFDKVVEIEGEVGKITQEAEQTILSFDNGGDYIVQAYLSEEGNDLSKLKERTVVKLKCKYSGYIINDEDFFIPADIKLEKCFLENE